MWIESITVHGFGCLAGRRYEFPRGKAALVVDENERGKSTLAAAIMAELCGFPRRRAAQEQIKLSEVYRPWAGESYSLEMEIEAGGMRLMVERDFARDRFTVRDRDTNRDISAQFQGDLALHFLRLPREDFQRIAVISGKEVSRFNSSPNLRERLSAVVEGTGGDSGAETAIALLGNAKYVLDGSAIKPETAVRRLATSIEEKARRMRELDAELDAAGEEVRALDDLRAGQDELERRSSDLDAEYAAARLAEVRERIATAERDFADRAEFEREMGELEPYAGFPAERAGQLQGAVARLRERSRQLDEKLARQGSLNSEADEVRAWVEPLNQLALATNDDLVGLAAVAEALADAREAIERGEQEAGIAKRGATGVMGRVLIGLGALCGVASIGLMVLPFRPFDMFRAQDGVAWSLVGVLIGALVAALGGVTLARAAGARTAAGAELDQALDARNEARDRAVRRLSALGVQVHPEPILSLSKDERAEPVEGPECDPADLLDRTQEALAKYLADRDRLQAVGRELASVSREIDDQRARIDEENGTIGSILGDAEIEQGLSLEEGLMRFDDAGKRHARYRQIRDTLMPALEKRMLHEVALDRLKSEEAVLRQAQDATLQQAQGDGGRPPARRWSLQIEAERGAARRELEETVRQIRELERGVGLKVEAYRREYPALEEEAGRLRQELRRASRYGTAIERATGVLREVAEGSRRRWAAALNERASAILPHLNPDYDTLRFDDSLDFTVRRVPDIRIIDKHSIDSRLSTGAKDQIYLAVRLACCAELSVGGESIPIILDDPLISFDDDRFATSLMYIVESLPRQNQVIILTCHRDRHERVAGEEWFRDGVAVVEL